MQISTNPIQYMMSEMQSVMSAQPFSGLASSSGAGQDVPASSASSTRSSGAPINPAAKPSSQMSPDLLSSLIAAQAGASGAADDFLSQLQSLGGRHHHHHPSSTETQQTGQSNRSTSTDGQSTADADESSSAVEGQSAIASPSAA